VVLRRPSRTPQATMPTIQNVEDSPEVMSFFEKFSYDAFPSKHLKYLEIPAWDCRETLEEEPVLHMSDKDMTDDDAVVLGRAMSIIKPPTLQRLYMTRNKLTGKGCAALAAGAADCPCFEVLYMQKNKIDDSGLIALSSSMKNSTMWQLVLTENLITDVGIKAFAKQVSDGKSFLKMKALYLDTNEGITDAGVIELAKVLHLMPELEILALQKCTIGDKGILALSEAVRKGAFKAAPGRNNWLYVFDQNGPGFDANSKATLRAACKDIAKAHVGWPPPRDDVEYDN